MIPAMGNRQSAINDPLAAQRKAVARALATGRRWHLRAALMMVIAVIAGMRGGQIMYALAVVLVLLAGLAISLGRSIRRSAMASLEKIQLMDKTGNRQSAIGNQDETGNRQSAIGNQDETGNRQSASGNP